MNSATNTAEQNANDAFVRFEKVQKSYDGEILVVKDLNLDIAAGEFLTMLGPSGSGKSTLLNLLGCLDRPTTGRLLLGEDNVGEMSDDELSMIRASRIGFVFQSVSRLNQLVCLCRISHDYLLCFD